MTKTTTMPIDQLRELLRYDPETGFLFRTSNGARALYTLNYQGYPWGRLKQKYLLAHRAAWAITYGEWPELIDHINRDRTDSRLVNLRKATSEENSRNTDIYEFGGNHVSRASRTDSWFVRYRGKYIGCFKSKEEANQVVETLKRGEIPSIKSPRKYTWRT